jgi:ArsR family transcriptional regulator
VPALQLKSSDRLPRWFRALGDETRLRIIELLRVGKRCVCDLTDELEPGQSRLSFHLKILKEAGIITDRRDGRWVYYTLNTETLDALRQAVESLKPSRSSIQMLRRCE